MQENFTNTVVIIATGFLGLSTLVLPPQAKSEETGKSCQAAMGAAKQRIEQGRNITVMIDTTDNSRAYPDYPKGREETVRVALIGRDADSVMSSPVFQKAIASEIIRSCNSIGAISFNKYQTGWTSTIGLMSDGTIQPFKCYESHEARPRLSWGLEYCDL